MSRAIQFAQLRVQAQSLPLTKAKDGWMIIWPTGSSEKVSHSIYQFLRHLDGSVEMRELLRYLFHKGETVYLTEAVDWLRRLQANNLVVNSAEVEQCLNLELDNHFSLDSLNLKKISTTPQHTPAYFTAERLKSYLSKTPLFSEGQDLLLDRIIQNGRIRFFEKGQAIIKKGSEAKEMYVLLTGAVGVYAQSPLTAQNLVTTFQYLNLFGESAALFAQKRTAYVVALEPTFVFEIPVAPIKNPDKTTGDLKNLKSLRTRVILNQLLASSRLFSGVTTDIIQFVLSKSSVCTVRIGDIVIQQGDQDLGIYFILKGRYEIIKDGKLLAVLKPGEYFGEMATLTRSPRTASVLATEDGLCLKVHQSDLFDLMIRDLRLGLYIEKEMILRLQEAIQVKPQTSEKTVVTIQSSLEDEWLQFDPETVDFSSLGHTT